MQIGPSHAGRRREVDAPFFVAAALLLVCLVAPLTAAAQLRVIISGGFSGPTSGY